MMDGKIWVESEYGKGSTFGFSIALPVDEAEPDDCLKLPEGLSRAMIVEPQEVTRSILERQLAVLGVESVCCQNGEEALAQIGPGIDLVVTDHNMPRMDGIELAEALREAGHAMPIVLLSHNTGYAEQDPGRVHLQAVLQKPVPRRELFHALAALATGKVPEPQLPEEPEVDDAPGRAMRVLAAEDNKTNRLVFSKMIKSLDIDLKFAENGHEALAFFQSFKPDIVFMDISMPGMDGKEATQHIRQIEAATGGHVPIVAMTAHAMEGDEDGILAAGLDHYMTKPLRKDTIIGHVIDACPPDVRPPEGVAEEIQASG
jgi:CheY-like chemotaxis protein